MTDVYNIIIRAQLVYFIAPSRMVAERENDGFFPRNNNIQ